MGSRRPTSAILAVLVRRSGNRFEMLNVAPQKERIPDHLRAMAEQDDKSAASGKTGWLVSIR